MKGFIYFALFFALALNWYFLASMPDDVEQVKEVRQKQIETQNISQVVEHSTIFSQQFTVFESLLNQKKWREAVDFYRSNYADFLQLNGVNVNNHPLKNQLMLTMQYLIAQEDDEHLSTLSSYLLVWYPLDVGFIQYNMMSLIQEGSINKAVDLYFIKYEEILDNKEKEVFAQSFEKWLDSQLLVWHGNNKDNTAKLVWQKLIKYEAEHVKWNVQLAQILVWQKKYKQAKSIIEPYQFEWDYQDEINQIMAEININYNANESIDLVQEGSHFLVDALFADNGLSPDEANVKLLIDTGASYTVVDQQIFDEHFLYIDKKRIGTVTASTANGSVEAQMYEVFEMKIGDYSINNVQFVVLDLSDGSSSAQGLLGMNFLKYFKFNIDQNNSVLTLSY